MKRAFFLASKQNLQRVKVGGLRNPSTEGSEAPFQLAKVKRASKPLKDQQSPFSLNLEGFEAFLSSKPSKPLRSPSQSL